MGMEAATTIMSETRRRVYVGQVKKPEATANRQQATRATGEEDDEEAALREIENERPAEGAPQTHDQQPSFIPDGIELTLEELPKWKLLRDVMREIEEEIQSSQSEQDAWTNNTVLIMTASARTTSQIRTLLTTMEGEKGMRIGGGDPDVEDESEENPGRRMMTNLANNYFLWKRNLGGMYSDGGGSVAPQGPQGQPNGGHGPVNQQISEALKRKQGFGNRVPPNKRRRVRGGGAAGTSGRKAPGSAAEAIVEEASDVASL